MIVVIALPSCKLTHKHAILVINVYYNYMAYNNSDAIPVVM